MDTLRGFILFFIYSGRLSAMWLDTEQVSESGWLNWQDAFRQNWGE